MRTMSAHRRLRRGCLASTVALGLLALIAIERALADAERLSFVYRPLGLALGTGAVAALVIGWLRPVPWLLALLLIAVLTVIWPLAVIRFLRVDAWGPESGPGGYAAEAGLIKVISRTSAMRQGSWRAHSPNTCGSPAEPTAHPERHQQGDHCQ